MSKVYVFSTLTSDQSYGIESGPVVIKGRINAGSRNLDTPRGVCTEVDEAQYHELQQHPVFAAHAKGGFISVSLKSISRKAEDKFIDDMEPHDNSAQETEESLKKKAKRAPKKD